MKDKNILPFEGQNFYKDGNAGKSKEDFVKEHEHTGLSPEKLGEAWGLMNKSAEKPAEVAAPEATAVAETKDTKATKATK